ncbi:general substrate transporter [Achaetomium macrosporum]|uniref:General substrate transporter n=1 Tax=Achaetomium macrosporum TaxID=79813 RepID=A0AAN7C2L8_9PEZI|nr:general substrate transporter [Achaetomium macrosporum]
MASSPAAAPEKEASKGGFSQHVEVDPPTPQPETPTKITFRDFWDNKRVLGYCLFIYLLPINFGYELSTVGNLLAVNPFLERFGEVVDGVLLVSAKNQQILNAATTVGLFTSAFTTGLISDIFGRKKTIIFACFLCIAGILTQYFSHTILQFFGGKLLSCFGFGLGHSLGPVYVAELAPVKMRGICLALVNTMIVVGQWLNSLAVYGSSFRTDDLAWRIPIATQIIPPGILLLGLPFLPESPSWLIIKGKPQEAAASFRKFNGSDFDVDTAMATTTAAVVAEKELAKEGSQTSWLQCFRGIDGRRTLIVCMVYISQQFIGVNFIAGYLAYYFKLAGVQNALGVSQAAYAVQLFGNICSWPLIDRVGRRPMIVGGCMVMTCGLLLIGGISTIGTKQALSATVAFMTLWGYLYQMTMGAVAYAVGAETPSATLRQKTYSINIMTATAFSCMVLQIMPYLINTDEANLGGKICFIFFGLSVPMCIYLYFCLPELKGRNYAEIQEMFQAKLQARKFKTYVCQNIEEMEASGVKAIMEA